MTPHRIASKSASTTTMAAQGAGAGALTGALVTLFKQDPSIMDYVKNALIGGGVGAAAGVGLGGLRGAASPAPPPTSQGPPSKPRLGRDNASYAGLLPIIGPAVYGAAQSADGDRLANALKLSGASAASALPGAALSGRYPGLGSLLSMAGSSYGTGAMADHIDKQARRVGRIPT